MTETVEQPHSLRRFKSGIAGLDRILGGGLFTGGDYLVVGPPGAGKTIRGNQLCFHHIATGGRAIYLSLLTQTSSRLLATLEPFTFYRPDPIGEALFYFSGYAVLERDGLEGLLTLIRTETRNQRATLLVMDGTAAAERVSSPQDWLRYQSIPVVLMSALRSAPSLAGCRYAALLSKPFELDELLQTITRLLNPNASS